MKEMENWRKIFTFTPFCAIVIRIMRLLKKEIIFLIGFPLLILLGLIFRDSIIPWVHGAPGCFLNQNYGLYCPSCGGTRSVVSLLHGDIISSLRYNILPFILLSVIIGFYCETLAGVFGKKIVVVPRRVSLLVIVILVFYAYALLRNFIPGLIYSWLPY